jgi:hypothetical protein
MFTAKGQRTIMIALLIGILMVLLFGNGNDVRVRVESNETDGKGSGVDSKSETLPSQTKYRTLPNAS